MFPTLFGRSAFMPDISGATTLTAALDRSRSFEFRVASELAKTVSDSRRRLHSFDPPSIRRQNEAAHGRHLTRNLILGHMAALTAGDPNAVILPR